MPIAALDTTQRDALKNGLTADVMGGYTPTECAYNYALDQVRNWQAPAEFVDAPRFIVLLTDGVPTVTNDCQTLGAIKAGSIPLNEAQYGGLIATVAQGTLDTGIKTFVGGVPGSDEPQGANYDPMYMLSLLAAAGGMALPNCTPEAGTMLCPDGTVPEINALGTAYCDQHGGNPQLTARGTYCHYDLTQGDMADWPPPGAQGDQGHAGRVLVRRPGASAAVRHGEHDHRESHLQAGRDHECRADLCYEQ